MLHLFYCHVLVRRKLMDFPSVLSKLVRTLVNTLMATTDEARVAIRHEKGLTLVREILARHPNHAELKKVRTRVACLVRYIKCVVCRVRRGFVVCACRVCGTCCVCSVPGARHA